MRKFEISPFLGLSSYSDLEQQPGFRINVKLDEALTRSAVIIAPYTIGPDLIPCGLTCHQGHNRGYLVRLADGSHTNVGRNCGSNHFGASNFDDQEKIAKATEKTEKHKQSVNKLIDEISSYRKRAHDLWHQSGPLGEALDAFKSLYPDGLYQDLRNRAQRKNALVLVTRKLDETEKAALEQEPQSNNRGGRNGKKSDFVQKRVGDLRGLPIFLVRPRSCLKSVQKLIADVENQDNESVTPVMLAKYAKYSSLIEEQLKHAEGLLKAGTQFFEAENFKLLTYVAEGQYANQVEGIAWDFEENVGRRLSYGQLKRLRKRNAS